jgi:hypothetical protein
VVTHDTMDAPEKDDVTSDRIAERYLYVVPARR